MPLLQFSSDACSIAILPHVFKRGMIANHVSDVIHRWVFAVVVFCLSVCLSVCLSLSLSLSLSIPLQSLSLYPALLHMPEDTKVR